MENRTKMEYVDNEKEGPKVEPWGTPEEWGGCHEMNALSWMKSTVREI